MMATWIPKDARQLLAGYYHLFEVTLGAEQCYEIDELRKMLGKWGYWQYVQKHFDPFAEKKESPSDNDAMSKSLTEKVNEVSNERNRVNAANRILEQYGYLNVKIYPNSTLVGLTLTPKGWQYGRRYSSWLGRTQIWFEQWRTHWLWLLAAMLGGGIVAKLFDWLFSGGKK